MCGEILSRGGPAPTDWSRLLEPLPFFELFRHFLQVKACFVFVCSVVSGLACWSRCPCSSCSSTFAERDFVLAINLDGAYACTHHPCPCLDGSQHAVRLLTDCRWRCWRAARRTLRCGRAGSTPACASLSRCVLLGYLMLDCLHVWVPTACSGMIVSLALPG